MSILTTEIKLGKRLQLTEENCSRRGVSAWLECPGLGEPLRLEDMTPALAREMASTLIRWADERDPANAAPPTLEAMVTVRKALEDADSACNNLGIDIRRVLRSIPRKIEPLPEFGDAWDAERESVDGVPIQRVLPRVASGPIAGWVVFDYDLNLVAFVTSERDAATLVSEGCDYHYWPGVLRGHGAFAANSGMSGMDRAIEALASRFGLKAEDWDRIEPEPALNPLGTR